jgi:hypothetical protein
MGRCGEIETNARRSWRTSGCAGQHRHHRVATQIIVIVDVLVAQRNPEHPQPSKADISRFLSARPTS